MHSEIELVASNTNGTIGEASAQPVCWWVLTLKFVAVNHESCALPEWKASFNNLSDVQRP